MNNNAKKTKKYYINYKDKNTKYDKFIDLIENKKPTLIKLDDINALFNQLKKYKNIKLSLNFKKEKKVNHDFINFLIIVDLDDFSNLELEICDKLICYNCNITKLPILNNCSYLDCNNNKIELLPNLKFNKFLNCSYNKLECIELQELNYNKIFLCNNNEIVNIPDLNNSLIVDCSFNKIESLIGLKKCKELICNNNNIKKLPHLKNCIKLIANNNILDNLNINLINCKYINISSNNIKSLPPLISCIELNCSNNNLIELPFLPNCKKLICDNNPQLYYTGQYSIHFKLDFPSPGYKEKMTNIYNNLKNISEKLNKDIYIRYDELRKKLKKKLSNQDIIDEILKLLVKEYLLDIYKKFKKLKDFEIGYKLQSLMEFNIERKNLQFSMNYISLYILDQKIRSLISLLYKNPTYPQFKLDFLNRKQVVSFVDNNPFVKLKK